MQWPVSTTIHTSTTNRLLTFLQGVLIECDPSIKAIIVKIDTEHHHDIIIEDIDDEHVLIKSNKHEDLKQLLKDVSPLTD